MRIARSISCAALAVVVLAGGTLLSACTPPSRESTASTQPTPAPASRPIGTMALEQKRAALPPEFPVEVPVPDGGIGNAGQQNDSVWTYDVTVQGTSEDLAAWYEKAYSAANWAEAERTNGYDGGIDLLFVKGDAQTKVHVVSSHEGSAIAQVSIGLGVPVGQTY